MVLTGNVTNPRLIKPVLGVAFDCDGVLFDSKDANTQFYNAIVKRMGLPPLTSSQIDYCHSHTAGDSINHITGGRLEEAKHALKDVSYVDEILPYMVPEPGLYDYLDFLRDAGLNIGIATNRSTTMELVAERFEFERYASPILFAGRNMAKPHPEMLCIIKKRWNLSGEEFVFIGDTEIDEQTARAAGVRFWAYKNENLRAELTLTDYFSAKAFLSRCMRVWSETA